MTARPRAARGWQKALLVGFGALLVVAFEGGARLAGFGGEHPLLRPVFPAAGDDAALFEIDPQVASPFFARLGPGGQSMVGGHRRELVTLPKPAGTVRVLALGASTVEGFPLPRNLTAARFLEEWLRAGLPGRRVEVVNLGITAIASYPVRVIGARAIAELDADLVVVYAGHNEFFGAAGVASRQFLGTSTAAMTLLYGLRTTAIYDLVGALLPERDATPDSRRNLIEVMAAVPTIPVASPLRGAAAATLESNLGRLAENAAAAGVPMLLATLVSNELDFAPIADPEAAPLDEPAGDDAAALRRTLDADPRHAAAAFRLGRLLVAEGRRDEGAEWLRRARDDDVMPWRAPSAANEAIRRVAAAHGVALADCEARFAEAAGGAPGWRFFYDHVHPSLEGQALLARCFLDVVVDRRLLPVDAAALPRADAWRRTAAELGANPLEHYLVLHKMGTLFSTPPLSLANRSAADRFSALLEERRAALDAVDGDAVARWERGSRRAGFALPISYFGGVAALRAGEPQRALAYLRGAAENAFPLSSERVAVRLLEVSARRLLEPPAEVAARARRAAAEADRVARTRGEPTALLATAATGLRATAGEVDAARRWAAQATRLRPGAAPWEAVLIDELVGSTKASER